MNLPTRSAIRRALILRLGLAALVVLGGAWLARTAWLKRGAAGPHSTAVASSLDMDETRAQTHRQPNRLIGEKSPYLLQHAYNPVDWFPWDGEAFEIARREDKPIFLSIGYSTCHWCHVMERESFENDSVAAILNRYFVSIKVDREERPDVDRIYMTAMQSMGMGGGWPLNVFLTPDLKPFFGGTYFPPDIKHGRPGLIQLLPRISEAWVEQRDQIEVTGGQVFDLLSRLSLTDSGTVDRQPLFERAYETLARSYDERHGGFGGAPKFPSTSNLNFLMRYWARDPATRRRALEMATRQLDAMSAGGIHDHIGGGFHRYATDADWLVPHFEKMLYDQAQIAWAYLEAFQATGREEYSATARRLFSYVARDLTAPEGAFFSAEDADSEGEEGKFYVWTPAGTRDALGEDAGLCDYVYGVTAEGNFEHQTTILRRVHSAAGAAQEFRLTTDEVEKRLERIRTRLLEARSRRERPHLDDKVLAAWNGLMISAFARGAQVLGDKDLARRAERAASFVWAQLYDEKSGDLKRRWRDGETAEAGQLDDYSYFALGLIDLYGATFDPRWLERAVKVTEAQLVRFWDERDGGFFESPPGDPFVTLRMKDAFDGAEMAGNSIAAYNLQVLATLLDRDNWREKAKRTLDYYARRIEGNPLAMPQMLVAMAQEQATPRHIVIAGRPEASDTRALVAEFNRRFLPHDELLLADGGAGQKRLATLAPFAGPLVARNGKATAYVCVNYACRLPTTDRQAFAAQLDHRIGQE